MNFGALGKELRNKKIVFIISFQWFTKEGLRPSQFSMIFSKLMFYSFMFNSYIDKNLKDYVAERIKYLSSEDERLIDLNKFCSAYCDKNINNEILNKHKIIYENLLENDNKIYKKYKDVLEYINDISLKFGNVTTQYDWESMKNKAQKVAECKTTNNKFGVENEYFNKYKKNVLLEIKNKFVQYKYSDSPEYNDFDFLLKVCETIGVNPLFIIVPPNGKWYDYCGFNVDDRLKHYKKIVNIINKYGFKFVDFSNYEYEEYFLRDVMHLGWKGWVYINEAIYDFFKK